MLDVWIGEVEVKEWWTSFSGVEEARGGTELVLFDWKRNKGGHLRYFKGPPF